MWVFISFCSKIFSKSVMSPPPERPTTTPAQSFLTLKHKLRHRLLSLQTLLVSFVGEVSFIPYKTYYFSVALCFLQNCKTSEEREYFFSHYFCFFFLL